MSGMLTQVCTPGLSMPGKGGRMGAAPGPQQQSVMGARAALTGLQVAHQQVLPALSISMTS